MRSLCAAVLVLCVSPVAWAQSGSTTDDASAAARTLFSEARELAAQDKHEQACPKFQASYRLRASMGALFNLADCWEHVARTASAWAAFLDVAAMARRAGEWERERVAQDRATALEPKLARITITVSDSTAGLKVERDKVVVGGAMF